MVNVYVVGCGGIGGYIVDYLPRIIANLSLSMLEKSGADISSIVNKVKSGVVAIPSFVDNLVLIDGDSFDPHSPLRQAASAGMKAEISADSIRAKVNALVDEQPTVERLLDVIDAYMEKSAAGDMDYARLEDRAKRLRNTLLMTTFMRMMNIRVFPEYMLPDNLSTLIPEKGFQNLDNGYSDGLFIGRAGELKDYTVVFIGVDRMSARYDISVYLGTFRNSLLINGGNSRDTGHVTVHERRNGVKLDPTLYELFDNVTADADLRPNEEHCTDVSSNLVQTPITNNMVACAMLNAFVKWAQTGFTEYDSRHKIELRYNEFSVDTNRISCTPLYHPL